MGGFGSGLVEVPGRGDKRRSRARLASPRGSLAHVDGYSSGFASSHMSWRAACMLAMDWSIA